MAGQGIGVGGAPIYSNNGPSSGARSKAKDSMQIIAVRIASSKLFLYYRVASAKMYL
jgi:hypothetical protein